MNVANEILKSMNDSFFVVTDEKGNIVFPSNQVALKLFKGVVEGQAKSGQQFYHHQTNSWFEYDRKEIIVDDKKYSCEYLRDITKYKKNMQIDKVTDLFNRRLTYEMLEVVINNARLTGEEFAVVMFDADLFKQVNDTYGHDCGDRVLRALADSIKGCVRHHNLHPDKVSGLTEMTHKNRFFDIVGHFGGDEFVLVLRNIKHVDIMPKLDTIKNLIDRAYIDYEGTHVKLCSISTGFYHVNEEEIKNVSADGVGNFMSEILHKSDIALYHSKENRGSISDYKDVNDYELVRKIVKVDKRKK